MEEVWKGVEGYEGLYEVSNFGRVRSLDKVDSLGRDRKGRILSPGTAEEVNVDGDKYLHVVLCRDGVVKTHYVHRLVAKAFVQKADGCDTVNHIDGSRSNNRSDNLEWTTYNGNTEHARKIGRRDRAIEARRKPVVATSLSGIEYRFRSIVDAAIELGLPDCARATISACCRGKCKTAYGYKWSYAD